MYGFANITCPHCGEDFETSFDPDEGDAEFVIDCDMFAELAQKHLGARDVNKLFPNHRINPGNYRGLIA
jgi:hypothetical protein